MENMKNKLQAFKDVAGGLFNFESVISDEKDMITHSLVNMIIVEEPYRENKAALNKVIEGLLSDLYSIFKNRSDACIESEILSKVTHVIFNLNVCLGKGLNVEVIDGAIDEAIDALFDVIGKYEHVRPKAREIYEHRLRTGERSQTTISYDDWVESFS